MDFSIEEYNDRINRTKQKMQERGIEVLIITNPSNMNYLTGYNVWSFYVPQFVLLVLDRDEPVWVGRGMDANSAKITTWLKEENIVPYPDDYVQSEFKHPIHFVSDMLREWKCDSKTLGIEMETHFFSARFYQELLRSLPEAKIEDASVLVNWVRVIKSPKEINYIEKAAVIAQKAMRTGLEHIQTGRRGCDVAAEIMRAQVKGTDDFGGDYTAIVPMLPAGEETSGPHITWSERRYKENEPVILELAGCHRRYHAPLARTMFLGEPPTWFHNMSEIIVGGLERVIDDIRPGMTTEEVEAIFRNEIGKHGLVKESRLGYSVGLSYPPDWGEHTVSVRAGDKTVIEPGMVFHLIPGIWDELGFEVSETIHITNEKARVLSNVDRGIYVKK